jgi:hypothetical protein
MKVHLDSKPVLAVHKRVLKKDRVVYFLVAPKAQKYAEGRSRIVYIGTTKKGARRIASSAAFRAQELLEQRGFRKLHVHVVSCGPRSGMKSWEFLEKACLAEFRSHYRQLPKCNKQGLKLRWNKKFRRLFRRERINKILMHFDATNRKYRISAI